MKKNKDISFFVYAFTLFGIIIWITGIFLAPYLKSQSFPLSELIYTSFSKICHQIESRCFYVFGNKLAVCSRCLGIYIGFFVGTIFFPFIRGFKILAVPKYKTFVLASTPIGIDTMGNFFFIWYTIGWLRLIFGFIWGLILPFYFITGITDFFLNLNFNRKKQ